jgi:hypothetical protein
MVAQSPRVRADSDCQPGDYQDDERKQREQPGATLAA